ncbi:T-cell-specific guanine nucleotide triphosphate-binding protein 2-like [Mya arenaria]|uniref:T-cell-specific guanine nucleotide triphosphate-binding protein 2-like n=1 Tax=Mya arenaria TaxID=6604 RepID=UPI0022E18623|nr:T-cell-specific guanine nucleotide triphosphate-binding protein 2-like [Mya arenaria]XP_052787459.1 T-cell-specific guanine nucleotide triphosphate-binding protein 2-like [Mya arenaria]XP_052787460.1 T-cell-specific guanine nucleotide triphosphate-binding protein 2-like [Mya arenaria]XP_052787462.1 T-cell-specific guanine nucleotide triphosphate-binding protein 2-like [Mya arenaria]
MDRDEEAESIEQLLAAQSEEEVSNVPGRRSLNNAGLPQHEEVADRQSQQEQTRRRLLKEAFDQNGYPGLHEEIKRQLNQWEDVNLNIAVIGMTGTGKSTFINTVIGRHVANTGSTETTLKCTPFSHPDYPNVKFWDIPGVGTSKIPKNVYMNEINFQIYDVFVLLFCNRVYTDSTWLVGQILEAGKKAYIVRTMIDSVNDSVQRDYQGMKTEDEVHEMIIKEIRKDLSIKIDRNHIFLICCYKLDYADFKKLLKTILQELPDLKRSTLILSLSATSDEIITAKVKELKDRIQWISIKTSVSTFVPIVGICVQLSTLYREAMFYRKQLGTDADSLKKIAKLIDCNEKDIYEKLEIKEKAICRSVFAVSAFSVNAGGYFFLKETAKVAVPVVGTLVSGASNYKWSVFTLESILSKFEIEARKLNRFLKEWTENKNNVAQ